VVLHGIAGMFGRDEAVIMTDRYKQILYMAPMVFGVENHCHSMVHVRENFVGYAAKLRIQHDASKDLKGNV